MRWFTERLRIERHVKNAQTGEADPLRRQCWEFVFLSDYGLVLDSYRMEHKESTRHRKWEIDSYYDRLRGSNRHDPNFVPDSEVPWPTDVRQEALDMFVAGIKVGRWSADFGR